MMISQKVLKASYFQESQSVVLIYYEVKGMTPNSEIFSWDSEAMN